MRKRERIFDALCTLADRTRRKGGPWSWVPGLDLLLAKLYYAGWSD